MSKAVYAIPERQRRWELTGAGLDRLRIVERPTPQPGPDQLLVRIDACGICFSDMKILNLGGDHPRLQGRDLERDPVVMGHEVAMTVVATGERLRDRLPPGRRFVVQADVYHQGQGMAFGYQLPGGFSEYQLIGPEILAGDEGCYLLPVEPAQGHAEAALCEPWACVEASYRYTPRTAPKPNGRRWLIAPSDAPGHLVDWFASAGGQALSVIPSPSGALQSGPFDDILLVGRAQPEYLREVAARLAPGGVLAWCAPGIESAPVAVDVGSVHYRGHWFTGAPTADPGAAYGWQRSAELTPGGRALFVGAGGPMGQMHLERAFSLPEPPACLVVTEFSGPRFDDLRDRFAVRAERSGIRFTLLDVRSLGEAVYDAAWQASGERGFDDVVVMVPRSEVIERAYTLLAPGGGLNVFAGVAIGTQATLDLARVAREGIRLWGTSGSTIADLREMTAKMHAGTLQPDAVVAAVGGLDALRDGLEAVRDNRFVGKTVIYPHLRGLPLIQIADLAARHPTIAKCLTEGRYWNRDAEAELLRLYGNEV
ncbi:MAG: alcohol dehydrogenase catalytic domain-containing protein [Armatimonadetes bacterium]|nr:alcohol dehydrogenase catalytic domain-containing protein [Armatimonadota bacterium]